MGPGSIVPMVTTVQSYTADIYICIMGASLITIVFPALGPGPAPLWEWEGTCLFVHLWEHEAIELPRTLGCPFVGI